MARKKAAMLLLWTSLFIALLGGCGGAPSEEQQAAEETDTALDEDSVYLVLYLPDDFSEELELPEDTSNPQEAGSAVVTAVPQEELSAECVADAYNSMVIEPEYGRQVKMLEVRETGNQVWVDFDSESVNQLEIEEGYEGQLFYNLARSIASNLSGVDEIYFTMDGGQDFTLRHLWFEADRPFYSGIVPVEEGGGEIGPD